MCTRSVQIFLWLVEELQSELVRMAKTLVVCKSIASCSSLYVFFDFSLQKTGYVDGVTKLENALFGMYHAKTKGVTKELAMIVSPWCKIVIRFAVWLKTNLHDNMICSQHSEI